MLKIEKILLTVLVIICALISVTIVGAVVGDDFITGIVQAAGEAVQQTESTLLSEDLGEMGLDEDWQVFRSEGFAFEIHYPLEIAHKSIPDQNSLNAGIEVSSDTPVWEFKLVDPELYKGTNLVDASLVIHVSRGESAVDACSDYKSGSRYSFSGEFLPVVEINGIPFWKDIVNEGVMGGMYQRINYRTVSQGACYELTQLVQIKNIEALPSDTAHAYDHQKVFQRLDQVLETFTFLDLQATFPEISYPAPKAVDSAVQKATANNVDGIDVSHWQGDIKWRMVGDAGYVFAFVKGTEGVGWTDVNFYENMTSGSDSGVIRGAYHFARPDLGNSGREEAEYFLSVVGDYLESGYLRPVLDLEVRGSLGQNALSNWVLEWMQTVENQTGIAPLLYTNLYYVNTYLTNAVTEYDLWIAYWTCDPTVTFDIPPTGKWGDWAFWQYCVANAGTVPGISTPIDLDIFNGIEESLTEYDAASPLWVSLTSDAYQAPTPYYADFTADVNGDATGPINYYLWWDCSSLEIDITSVEAACGALPQPLPGECLQDDVGMKCNQVANEVQLAEYTYQEIGDFTAKVIVERGGASPAEDRYQISTTNPIQNIEYNPLSPGTGISGQPFALEVGIKVKASISGALQVDILEQDNLVLMDTACVSIPGDQLLTEIFNLSISSDNGGLIPYEVKASYRALQDCPVEDLSLDDITSDYLISWPDAEINVMGNDVDILNGSTTTSAEDGTDFGKVQIAGETVTRVFTIVNTGNSELSLTGDPSIFLTGNPAGSFSLGNIPAQEDIAPGESRDFEVIFDPQILGIQSASINIPNNDGNENPFTFMIQGSGLTASSRPPADFDGDGDTDISVYKVNPWGSIWYIKGQGTFGWGNADSIPVPGDYDGNGTTDAAVYNDGAWYIKNQPSRYWGDADSIPVPGDYDGNGTTDVAVFKIQPWGGAWYITGQGMFGWGNADSIPVPGDYDGNGTTDAAVYNDGAWYIKYQPTRYWGDADSIPVPGDYDGNGTTDVAVFKIQPWGGVWYIKGQGTFGWGNADSIPVPGDYDGNGTTDAAVYNDGAWYIKNQPTGYWGDADSYPLPAPDTNGDGDPYQ